MKKAIFIIGITLLQTSCKALSPVEKHRCESKIQMLESKNDHRMERMERLENKLKECKRENRS